MQSEIEALYDDKPADLQPTTISVSSPISRPRSTTADIRAAEPDASAATGWRVNAWVKKGILLGFRMGGIVDMSVDASACRSSISPPTR